MVYVRTKSFDNVIIAIGLQPTKTRAELDELDSSTVIFKTNILRISPVNNVTTISTPRL